MKKFLNDISPFLALVTSIASVVIAIIALLYSIKHNEKSVQPLLRIYTNASYDDKKFGIYLYNAGNGPAIIRSIKINEFEYPQLTQAQWLDLLTKFKIESMNIGYLEKIENFNNQCSNTLEIINKTANNNEQEIANLEELKLFLLAKGVSNNCFDQMSDLGFLSLSCYKTSHLISSHSAIKEGINIPLMVINQIDMKNRQCTKEMKDFAKWLEKKNFEIKYESLYGVEDVTVLRTFE